ncbi:MAG: hypothetical protein IM542_14175, partial [Pseudanabaena sp. M165S2SP1A06QC]|nr:hypothetical protein [Pseudanabaena sp. M165S2SP1A06QC]
MYGLRSAYILPAVALVAFTTATAAIAQPEAKLSSIVRFKTPGSAPEIIAASRYGNRIV